MALDDEMMLIHDELLRILGSTAASEGERVIMLPFPVPSVALGFLSRVPAGTTLKELERLAREFAAASNQPRHLEPFVW